jgi:hypothetical protein
VGVPSTPQQIVRQGRFERLIGLAAPFLDLMLSAGDRLSKVVGQEDEYYPIRSAGEVFNLPEPASSPASPPAVGGLADSDDA